MTATPERAWFGRAVADGALDDITIGSLCTGYGGLGEAVRSVIGGRHIWVADNDPDAAALLAYRYPDVPNLGDITQVDWTTVPPVDVLEFGFPCTDISCAGGRAGLREGTRSGIWANCFEAVAVLRPSLVVVENVRNLVSIHADSDLEFCAGCMGDGSADTVLRALGAVLGDLAGIFYDTQGCCVRASDTGAPHKRDRIFILAWPAADSECNGQSGRPPRATGEANERGQGFRPAVAGCGGSSAEDADGATGSEWRLAGSGEAEGRRTWSDAGRSGRAAVASPPPAVRSSRPRQPGTTSQAGRTCSTQTPGR
jgi:DNA (cytosine-5)-methyltransferase 1